VPPPRTAVHAASAAPGVAIALLVMLRGGDVLAVLGAALGAAAIARLVLGLTGDGPASVPGPAAIVGAVSAGLAWGVLAPATPRLALAGGACAAAAWALDDLGRGPGVRFPALAAAALAAVGAPVFVPLLLVVGVRLLAQRPTPRWAPAVPVVALLALAIGVPAALAHGGALGGLWRTWSGLPPLARPGLGLGAALTFLGEALGPIAAVAAACGAVLLIGRRWVAVALASLTAVAAVVELRLGVVGVALPLCAAVAIGAAVARMAAMVRLPVGQAVVGATVAALVVAPSAWMILG
jgi:hypothetical protein